MELRKDEQITLNIDGFIISQNIHNTNTAQSLFGIKNKNDLNIGHDDRTWVLEQDIICDTCNRCVSCQTCNSCDGCVSTVGCNDRCQGCTGSCTGCASGCYESCFGDCYTCQDCQAGCTSCNSCTAGCDGGCQTECYACVNCDSCVGCNLVMCRGDTGCQDGQNPSDDCINCTGCAGCYNNCNGSCVGCVGCDVVTGCIGCADGCNSACQTSCNACVGCTGGCQGSCQVCVGCTGGCQGGCQTGCQTGCTGCTSCTGCNNCNGTCTGGCVGCQPCNDCFGCTGCVSGCQGPCQGDVCGTCTNSCQSGCTTGCQDGCQGCYSGCTSGCDGCQNDTSPCGYAPCDKSGDDSGDDGGDDSQEGEEDAIRPGCWNTDSGGYGKNPPTNSGCKAGGYDGENNGKAPKAWLNSGKTQEQWDALSREGVEDFARESGLEIKPTDPKGGDDGTAFVGPELSAIDKALGLNGKGQPKTNYHVDYQYNPKTGKNEGTVIGEDGKVLGKITQTPGSEDFTIENQNNPEGVKSSTSTVKVNQDTGKTGDPHNKTENNDGSSTESTEEGTKYTGTDGKTVDVAPTGGGC